MKVLVVDVGGTHVKVLATGQKEHRRFDSGPKMTPKRMVAGVLKITADWPYEAVSVGYPGPVLHNRPVAEPCNLGCGWVAFNFGAAFKHPVKLINDAAMQALGSYKGGKMLFLGLGTGLGSTLIADGVIEPMELGHLPYKKYTYEDYVGERGLERWGKRKWRRSSPRVAAPATTPTLLPEGSVFGASSPSHRAGGSKERNQTCKLEWSASEEWGRTCHGGFFAEVISVWHSICRRKRWMRWCRKGRLEQPISTIS
jgi:polyphosphate glucokinase